MKQIKREYLDLLRGRTELKWKLVIANNLKLSHNGIRVLNEWIRNNDPNGNLTKYENLVLLSKGLNLRITDLLETVENGTIKSRKASCCNTLQ